MSAVVSVPLDAFAARCGHCGELCDEGPTTCPSCERRTIGRRTDGDPIAWGRPESDPCQLGTVGCSIDHAEAAHRCETW